MRVEANDPKGSTHQQPGEQRGTRQGKTLEEPQRIRSDRTVCAHCFGEKQIVIEIIAS